MRISVNALVVIVLAILTIVAIFGLTEGVLNSGESGLLDFGGVLTDCISGEDCDFLGG